MRNAVSSGLRQAAGIRTLLALLAAAGVVLLNCADPVLRMYRENTSFYQGLHTELIIHSLRSDTLSAFLPILAVLPFAGCYVDDVKSKFARFLLIRGSFRRYLLSRVLVCFLTGGLVVFLGAALAWCGAAVLIAPLERKMEGRNADDMDTLLQLWFLVFLNGGLWAVVGMAMSTLMESKYIAYAAPFVAYYLLVILYERYFSDCFLIYPREWIDPSNLWPFGLWGPAVLMIELTLAFALIFVFRARRRLREL